MTIVWRCLYADWYKIKHTSFTWLHIGLPCLWAAIYLAYMYGRPSELGSMYSSYIQVLGIVIPLLSAIICGMVTSQEAQAGQFQNVLIRTRFKPLSYVSKFLFVWGSGSLAILLAVLLFGLGASLLLGIAHVPYVLLIKGALYLMVSSAILYVIHLWVSFTFGMGASILMGGAGTLVAALMITSIGDPVWHYIPYAWGARMASSEALLSLSVLTEDTRLRLEQDVQTGWLWIVAGTLVILIASLWWFRRWEGSKNNE